MVILGRRIGVKYFITMQLIIWGGLCSKLTCVLLGSDDRIVEACLTSDCITLSASILSSLDTSQDPCENFYDFASEFPIPSAEKNSYRFNVISRWRMACIPSFTF